MRLHPQPFKRIKAGTKTNELRVNDEKRQQISVGDEVEFISRETDERLLASVTDLTSAASFDEILKRIDFARLDSLTADHAEAVRSMHQYYSPNEESKYGVIAIGFKIQT